MTTRFDGAGLGLTGWLLVLLVLGLLAVWLFQQDLLASGQGRCEVTLSAVLIAIGVGQQLRP